MLIKIKEEKEIEHYYWLDWLRFVSALMVVISHARGGNWVEWAKINNGDKTLTTYIFFCITRAGLEWVVVFFVLSGFLVGGKTIKKINKKEFTITKFIIDRVSRVWTPLIPVLFLSSLCSIALGNGVNLADFLGNLLGFQGVLVKTLGINAPLWSLAYEIWFYILIGAFGAIASMCGAQQVCALLVFAASLLIFTKLSAVYLFCWIIGAIGFFINANTAKIQIAGSLIIALVGYLASQLVSESLSLHVETIQKLLPRREQSIIILATGISMFVASLSKLRPRNELYLQIEKWGTSAAAFSYTLYLSHYPILALLQHLFPNKSEAINSYSCLRFFGFVSICIASAWLLYLPFERQTCRIRIWLKKNVYAESS